MARYTILLVFLVLSHLSFAQVVEESKFEGQKVIKVNKPKKETLPKDTLAKSPRVDSAKTTLDSLQVDPNQLDAGADVGEFSLDREPTIVNESRLNQLLGDLQIVKVSEELKIDCVWVKAAEYYSVWDSRNINPYGKSASLFKDTVEIELYNTKRGELWSAPLEKTLQTSGFGYRWGRFHQAVDLNLRTGEPVFSVFDGIVRISGFNRWLGHYIVMRHLNGLETLYAHLSNRKVQVGQEIKAGQLIGLGGSTGYSTGPHLHFEVRYQGNSFNPLLIYDFSKQEQLITQRFNLMPHHFRHLGNKVRKTIVHKVVSGETLSIISAKYNVSVMTLAKLNSISVNSVLKVGQRLFIVK